MARVDDYVFMKWFNGYALRSGLMFMLYDVFSWSCFTNGGTHDSGLTT